MEIRESVIKDLEDIAVLFDRYRQFYDQASDVAGAKVFLFERMSKKESMIYVADEGGKLLGFVQLYPIFTSVGMKRCWLLNDLFVHREHRNKGIARKLIDAGKRLAKETNASGLLLETSKTNREGNALYPKEGFVLQDSSNFYLWSNPVVN